MHLVNTRPIVLSYQRTKAAPPVKARQLIVFGLTALGLVIAAWLTYMTVVVVPGGQDAHAYWYANPADPYASSTAGGVHAYLYSPAFLQVIAPLKALPWPVFHAVWVGALAALVVLVSRHWSPFVLLIPIVWMELANGNIHIALGVASAWGLRYPALFALPLLTKVTPGVGLVWFLVRREWRNLAIALGVTGGIALVSLALGGQWVSWLEVLTRNAGGPVPGWVVPVPLSVRLVAAAVLVAWGGLTNRPWTVVVGGMLALPSLGIAGLSMLVGLMPLLRSPRSA